MKTIMKNTIFTVGIVFLLGVMACTSSDQEEIITSPNKEIKVAFSVSANGIPEYSVTYNETQIIENSVLGLNTQIVKFDKGLMITGKSTEVVNDKYTLNNGKKQHCEYKAKQTTFNLENAEGNKLDIIFRVSDDGVAFRYYLPETNAQVHTITTENTSFHFNIETRAWLQPIDDVNTGFCGTNPSYERHHLQDIPVGTVCPTKAGWAYPALFKRGNVWALISESGMEPTHCASRLGVSSDGGIYKIAFPMKEEVTSNGKLLSNSALPWATPWRIIVLGDDLAKIAESTLGTDLAKPSVLKDVSWIKPGKSSWSWVLLKDDFTTAPVQKEFIDYASDMGWEYCLIDAYWDQKIGYDKIQELADYAKTKNVGLILWYNSAGDWNTTEMTPRDKMTNGEIRRAEFAKLQEMGITGIKVDFFAGDGQSVIAYYHDILADAAKYKLTVNCHGATLPRGLQRTYPNYLTNESIKGYEFTTFFQADMDKICTHACMIPFTRNCFDPMDFTPMCFSEVHNINRISSNGFELATAIVFTSGIQHYAETPQGMANVPSYVKDFIKDIPSVWEDVKLIDGYPGKLVVIARKSGNDWYVAGINGELKSKTLKIDLSFMEKENASMHLISDGANNRSLENKIIKVQKGQVIEVECLPNGGFSAVIE